MPRARALVTLAVLALAAPALALPPGEHGRGFRDGANHHLGDDSFVALHHRAPGPGDGERERMHDHLQYVHDLLARAPATSPALAARRAELLGYLADYIAAGITPANTYVPWRSPVFIDASGAICAVGYLIERSAGRPLAEQIAAHHRLAFLEDIAAAMPEVGAWVKSSGFTLDELASIQPGYQGPDVALVGGFAAAPELKIPDGAFRVVPEMWRSGSTPPNTATAGAFDHHLMTGAWTVTVDGKILGAGTFARGAGTWTSSYPDGQKRATGAFAHNHATGTWRFFHPSGRVAAEGAFADGKRDGAWTFYYDTPEHRVLSRGRFAQGAITGVWHHYDADGTLLATANGIGEGLLVTITPGATGIVHERHGGIPAEEARLDGYYAHGERIFVDETGAMHDAAGEKLERDARGAWTAADCHWSAKRKRLAQNTDIVTVHAMLMADRAEDCEAPHPLAAARAQTIDGILAAAKAVRAPAPPFVQDLARSYTSAATPDVNDADLASIIAGHMTWYMEWPFIDGMFDDVFATLPGYGDNVPARS